MRPATTLVIVILIGVIVIAGAIKAIGLLFP